ncbi:chaplin family protein [Streptomyces sp. NPDC017260]|uniref:chaplin family protein n=1 Tax=unclassified Streptomyces TaxID=2593676 RepID=UPI0037891B5A
MRQTLNRGMVAAAAATGILSLCGSPALADSYADAVAKNSPGVASGNTVQAPVHVPVNVCGNSVNVVGALNPAAGNECANQSQGQHEGSTSHDKSHDDGSGYGSDENGGYGGGYGEDVQDSSGAYASGEAVGSPGVASGNNVQVPVDVPVNVCGNTADVIGALNPAYGNSCETETTPGGYGDEEKPPPADEEKPPPADEEKPPPPDDEEKHSPPDDEEWTPPTPPTPDAEQPPVLAETGDEVTVGAAVAGTALLAGGVLLYRRGRAASRR